MAIVPTVHPSRDKMGRCEIADEKCIGRGDMGRIVTGVGRSREEDAITGPTASEPTEDRPLAGASGSRRNG